MPTYDFKCTKCGDVFEDIVPMKESTLPCPECDGIALKQFSATRTRPTEGLTLADGRIRDTIKRVPRAPSGGVLFDRGDRKYI